jgi:hypothetical protein
MIQSGDPLAAGWPLTGRSGERLERAATAALRWVVRRCGLGSAPPELWMSREWLEERELRSRTNHDGV